MPRIFLLTWFSVLCCLPQVLSAEDTYGKIIKADGPVGWWRFERLDDGILANEIGEDLSAQEHRGGRFPVEGPRPSDYPDFSPKNQAVRIDSGKNYFVVKDPGDDSVLDFKVGDGITLEAWVKIDSALKGGYPYIIGKGRTHNPGTNHNNQSYSLRLATAGGKSALSFFFVDESGATKSIQDAGHRWTSVESVSEDGYWHHVAVTYTFGEEKSMCGYIDGKPITGKWDMAGATTAAPITDNDELWIGSSMSGGATLGASLDEVAIYRKALSAEAIKKHANVDIKIELFTFDEVRDAPTDHVRVEILEKVSAARKWTFRAGELEPLFETDQFALNQLPHKYNDKGLIIDRPIPIMLHMSSTIDFAGGDYEFILRSLDASRLYIDGKLVAETGFINLQSDAHQDYYDLPDYGDDLLSLAAGQLEVRQPAKLTPGKHLVSLYRLMGNKKRGNYLGEMTVGFSRDGGNFQFLAPNQRLEYTDAGWLTFLEQDRLRLLEWNQRQRFVKSKKERDYWQQRHEWAESQAGSPVEVPEISKEYTANNDIDHFILAGLEKNQLAPTGEISDWEFLRRVTLDTIGTIPSAELIQVFFGHPKETRRSVIIDELLDSPDWADHWVGYWQDALAENPGLTKPELNNSGPFRWYLHESFLDNKPFDRFVTELAEMGGSAALGGPAGFGIATSNDVPMAAKAHIIGTAFLAVEMKCARCHDAPYHDVLQEDLFSMAALLNRGPQKIPGSSSIPLSPGEVENLLVKVTLQPGSDVKPAWPFTEFVSVENTQPLPQELLRGPEDSRQQLAAMLTTPQNKRFTQVIVNRVWAKFLGRGLVHPVDDWEDVGNQYPELLDSLCREFILNGYDIKALSRSILNSNVYQRALAPEMSVDSIGAEFFTGPIRRKMTGEQLADSLYAASGKPFGSEKLTMDADGKLPSEKFVHLGIPRRAWQLITVSNERDRPSMTLPVAQSVIDLMVAYGWRQQRQEPITHRVDPLTALQPMALANGTSALRAIDFSDDSLLTKAALKDQPVEAFVEELFERLLTRTPTSDEREMFSQQLRDGYTKRIVAGSEAIPPKRIFRSGVTWISHFHPDSDNEAIQRMREIIKGDRKSARLDPDLRERAEDVVWVLVNSPEFIFVP